MRMHEHVLAEEIAIDVTLILFTLLLLGTILQGAAWLYELRRAAAIPLLLMPPAREMARALLLGLVLPLVIYWLYSRLPVIGGREFGWASGMWPRFAAELSVLVILLLWLPAHFIRGYIRRRCDELGIAMPTMREEAKIGWRVRGAVFVGVVLAALVIFIPGDISPFIRVAGMLLVAGIVCAASWPAAKRRRSHGLYYGTLARSLAPVYAFSIIIISLLAQPWLLYNEAQWLRRDTIFLGQLANPHTLSAGCNSIENQATADLSRMTLQALEGKQ